MRQPLLISASTIALIAGFCLAGFSLANFSLAHAQGTERAAPSSQPPAAQRSVPPEKMGPAGKTGPAMNGDTRRAPESGTTGQGSPNTEPQRSQDEHRQGTQPSQHPAPRANPQHRKAPGASDNRSQERPNAQAPAHKRGQGTTGQGAAGASANLTSEQRTKISTTIRQTHVRPVTHVNFNVAVGTVIPRSIHVHTLPPAIVDVYPDWRGYNFVLVGDEIVIIDPATHRIVAVIDA
jgi:hypothetical protein